VEYLINFQQKKKKKKKKKKKIKIEYTGSSNNNKKSDGEGWMEVGPKNKPVITREAEIKESPINRIFGGKIKSILKSPGNKQSATYEPFLSLQLDITVFIINNLNN